jgi:hypothetical protein
MAVGGLQRARQLPRQGKRGFREKVPFRTAFELAVLAAGLWRTHMDANEDENALVYLATMCWQPPMLPPRSKSSIAGTSSVFFLPMS